MKKYISVFAIMLIISLTACSNQKDKKIYLHLQAMKAIHNLTVLRHWTRVFGLIMNIQRDFLFHPAQLHGQY